MSAAPTDLREFLAGLVAAGELHSVEAEVDPHLEIAAVTDRICKSPGGGPALRFDRPRGSSVPVLTNLFGSPRRMALALGVKRLDELAPRLAAALDQAGPGGGMVRLANLTRDPIWQPRAVTAGPCREIRQPTPDLNGLPALHSWPGDGGRYLTLPLVFTRHPDSGEENCGMYRLQLFAPDRLGLHLSANADAARHLAAWHRRGEPMPVAVALGGPPALIFAAGLPLPGERAETAFAGFLQGAPLELVPGIGNGLRVPACAEFVIEGEISPGATHLEGPFGNHTGVYVAAAPAPLLQVTAVSKRRNPLYPCTVVGPPPMEDCWLAKAAERLLLPVLQQDVPELVDWNLPLEGIFHGCALVSVDCRPGRGRLLLQRLRSHPLLARSRMLVLFDGQVDVRDLAACYWRAINLVDPQQDLTIAAGRIDLDATGSDPATDVGPAGTTRQLVAARWREYGLADNEPAAE
jgi:4-hydroxy-3-polyprenylbenzoate decarboxylase